MLKKIAQRLDSVSLASKTVMFIGVGAALLLIAASLFLMLIPNTHLSVKYLYEYMAKTASTLFAQGVVFGLVADIFLK